MADKGHFFYVFKKAFKKNKLFWPWSSSVVADKGHFFLHRGYSVPEGLEVWNFTPWTVFDVWFECHQFWVDPIISRAVIPPQSYKNWPKSKFARAAWLGTSKIARALIFCEAVYNCLESSQKIFRSIGPLFAPLYLRKVTKKKKKSPISLKFFGGRSS